jgi:hypothetical protein
VVVACLAAGVGLTVLLFTLLDAVVLRPLPYPFPDRLLALWESQPADGITRLRVSAADFEGWRTVTPIERMVLYGSTSAVLLEPERAVELDGTRVGDGYFTLLGLTPRLGRVFGTADFAPSAPPVVVLTHALWTRRFAADPAIVGRTVVLGETPR